MIAVLLFKRLSERHTSLSEHKDRVEAYEARRVKEIEAILSASMSWMNMYFM